jgi:hypothetical protein
MNSCLFRSPKGIVTILFRYCNVKQNYTNYCNTENKILADWEAEAEARKFWDLRISDTCTAVRKKKKFARDGIGNFAAD